MSEFNPALVSIPRKGSLASVVMMALLSVPLAGAQAGEWGVPFHHDISTNFPNLPITPDPMGRVFNAIQMHLIAKPPRQGWVLVIDHAPKQPFDPQNPNQRAYQRYALIKPGDPDHGGPAHVFVNRTFMLPGWNQRTAAHPDEPGDFFCSHQVQTQDGNVFFAGGVLWDVGGTPFDGSKLVYIWDPALDDGMNGGWFRQDDLQQRRYYPSVIVGETLGANQRFYVAGGLDVATNGIAGTIPSTYEVYELTGPHATGKDNVNGAAVYQGPGVTTHPQLGTFYWYPWLHLLSDGHVFMAGFAKRGSKARHDPLVLLTQWNMTVGAIPRPPYPPTYWDDSWSHYGSSVLLPIDFNTLAATRDRVLRMGGRFGGPGNREVDQTAYLADVDQCTPTSASQMERNWSPRPPLTVPRKFCNAVLLPDGSILVIGGEKGGAFDPYNVDAERLVGDVREFAGDMRSIRDYHSTAVLLPDGRVLVGGGNNRDWDYQICSPWYLSAGPRPVITSAPGNLTYGQGFSVAYTLSGTSAYAAKVILMRPGSTTHHYDCEQRLLELQLVTDPPPVDGTLQVQAPPGSNYAPKGYYMMFVVTDTGVPSVATWVQLL